RLVLLDLRPSSACRLGQMHLARRHDPAVERIGTADITPREDQAPRGVAPRREVSVADNDGIIHAHVRDLDGAPGEDDSASDALAADGTGRYEQGVYSGIHGLDLLSADDEARRSTAEIGDDTAAYLDLGADLRRVAAVVSSGQVVPAGGDSRLAELLFPQVDETL